MWKFVTFIFVSSQAQQLIKKSTANTALQILFKLIIHSVLQARGRSAQEHKAVQQHKQHSQYPRQHSQPWPTLHRAISDEQTFTFKGRI